MEPGIEGPGLTEMGLSKLSKPKKETNIEVEESDFSFPVEVQKSIDKISYQPARQALENFKNAALEQTIEILKHPEGPTEEQFDRTNKPLEDAMRVLKGYESKPGVEEVLNEIYRAISEIQQRELARYFTPEQKKWL